MPRKIDPIMVPATGERLWRFVGDRVPFALQEKEGTTIPASWQARLRTNIGRDSVLRREIFHAHTRKLPLDGASWHDVPMRREGDRWTVELTLTEPGWFQAKAFFIDDQGAQYWPWGPNVGVSVHPDSLRTANTIYCAFPRLFGETKSTPFVRDPVAEANLHPFDERGYTVIPPSGKLRHLIPLLPHIHRTLGCGILHLLPVNPTPTTFARFGRYGSPYASQDLTAIDLSLVEFDKRTTGIDQFRELTDASHCLGGRVFIDLVTNHTGWGATVQELHPEWYLRDSEGKFVSPGAWGTIWEDLAELSHKSVALWDYLAEVFLTWCRRGVDGFRCDAGYMVPTPAWQYITARVREEFPETVFLLEGLGGAWEATESILTEGGMQWAYSELFQNYRGPEVSGYLDHALRQSQRSGLLVHYSETHDNPRLAAQGRAWSLVRNFLCGLASTNGGFGFTCGVEWLAAERINVHSCTGLSWGGKDNIVPELGRLNQLLASHPCFFDGARIKRVSPRESSVLALRRESAEGRDVVLVLVNLHHDRTESLALTAEQSSLRAGTKNSNPRAAASFVNLLGEALPAHVRESSGKITFKLEPATAYCLAATPHPVGMYGDAYRSARARAAWAIQACFKVVAARDLGPYDWRKLADTVEASPLKFLASLARLDAKLASQNLDNALQAAREQDGYPHVVLWEHDNVRRITPVPPGHWLLIRQARPFRASLQCPGDSPPEHAQSIPAGDAHYVAFAPRGCFGDATLSLELFNSKTERLSAALRYLAEEARPLPSTLCDLDASSVVLLTNGLGSMARVCVDLGRVTSKYDCLLGASLHPRVPVDRHILVKRMRVWVNADGFIGALNRDNLIAFEPGPAPRWRFVANAGDGRAVEIQLTLWMVEGQNTTLVRFERPPHPLAIGRPLPPECDVRLVVRFDIEDRNFHSETKRNGGAEHHFSANSRPLTARRGQDQLVGFEFTPARDRQLRVFAMPEPAGKTNPPARLAYHHEAEWSVNIPHPVEAARGQEAGGDAFSPGWFELPLEKDASAAFAVTAEPGPDLPAAALDRSPASRPETFDGQLVRAARQFVVRRDAGRTVIAGYPWFLDWGRDSLICARGLLAAGLVDEVRQLLLTFARFEEGGTLPNTIHGDDASNRDTSDAPLWFGVACGELASLESSTRGTATGSDFFGAKVNKTGRTVTDVLRSIAVGYLNGTSNGIRVDAASGLVWSPSHFTWMDTNYPAGTPREGYPVEIQVLWIQLLRQLDRLRAKPLQESWSTLADRAQDSLLKLFWLDERGWLADQLVARPGLSAAQATPDNSLRSNCLMAISFGILTGERARRCVDAAQRYLVIPGALRSLAPLPVSPPLPVYGNGGGLLNDPNRPYCGRYEGDEDTRRKPAYHNGTAWTWTFPVFCEALVHAWNFSPEAVDAARAYLGSIDRLILEGCVGQIPEVLDGDAPHAQRGCDAQAWGVTETLRVWRLLAEDRFNSRS